MKKLACLCFCMYLLLSTTGYAMGERLSDDIFNGNGIIATDTQKTAVLKILNDTIGHKNSADRLIKAKKDVIQDELRSTTPNRELMVSLNTEVAGLVQTSGQAEIDAQLSVRAIVGPDNYKKIVENIEKQKAAEAKEKQQTREKDRGPGLGGESREGGGGF